MNKQEYIKKIEDKLNSMNLGWKYQVSDYASNNEMGEEFEKEGKEEVSKVSNDLFSLFLDMAEGMISESKTLHGNFHTYVCDHIDEESEIKHPIQVTHQCFVVDQFKEKIEELKK